MNRDLKSEARCYFVCGGTSSIVFVVEKAGDVGEVAFLAWNPKVTREKQFKLKPP